MTLRGVNWAAVLGGSAVGAAILALCVAFVGDTPPLTYARLGLVALVAAAAFVLDEPAAAAVDAAPATLRRRTTVRATALGGPFTVWTAGVLTMNLRSSRTPAGALIIEGAGALAVAVAAAAILRVAGRSEPGEAVATVLGGTVLGVILLNPPPRSVPFFPLSEGWAASTALWGSLMFAAAVLVVAASRDPYRR